MIHGEVAVQAGASDPEMATKDEATAKRLKRLYWQAVKLETQFWYIANLVVYTYHEGNTDQRDYEATDQDGARSVVIDVLAKDLKCMQAEELTEPEPPTNH